MDVTDPSKKKLTIQECISSLETLFKAYQKDSEFNYQLSVCDSPFNQLKRLLNDSGRETENALDALRDLAASHIELVKRKDACYFRIKGSKGTEKSFTGYSFLDFWKEWFTPVEEEK